MPERTISMMLVDDHPLFRSGVIAALKRVDGFSLVAEASDGESAIGLWREIRPDVTLVDIALPGISGIEVIQKVQAIDRKARLLALSSAGDPETRAAALRAGAAGYILKTVRFEDLVAAIRSTAEGLRSSRFTAATQPRRDNLAGLTAREFEVLQLLRLGMQYEEIADELTITARTARKHATNIKEKLNAANVAEAVAIGFERGLLSTIPHHRRSH